MQNFLRNLKFKFVSLVDKGANYDPKSKDGAHILLYKADNPASVHVDAPVAINTPKKPKKKGVEEMKKHQTLIKKLTELLTGADDEPETVVVSKEHVELLKNQATQLQGVIDSYGDVKLLAATHPVHQLVKQHEILVKMGAECDTAMKAANDDTETDDSTDSQTDQKTGKKKVEAAKMDEVTKRHVESLEKRVKDSEDRAKAAEDIAKSEREVRLNSEMVSVLKSFRATALNIDMKDANNDVVRFRKMQDSDPASFARTMEIMKATDSQLAESALYKQFGTPSQGGPGGSAWEQIEAKADQLLEKAAGKNLTREEALNKIMEQNPKLVKQYREEQQ